VNFGAFGKFKQLLSLMLQSNKIVSLSYGKILSPEKLDLSENAQTVVKKNYFNGLTNLTNLDPRRNKIREI